MIDILTKKRGTFTACILGGALLIILPIFLPKYVIVLITSVIIFSLYVASLNLLMGYAGLVSLGHATFWGVAGYIIGILSTRGILNNFYLLILVTLLMVAVVGALLGILVTRTSKAYFIMLTFTLGHVIYCIGAFTLRPITKGIDGLTGITRPDLGLPWPMTDDLNFYYLVLVVSVICFFISYLIIRSPFGHALVGIRDNDHRMLALGYNTWLYKYLCYIISGIFSGVAGILYVYFDGFVSPSELHWLWSAEGLMMVLIGGSGTFIGPVVGAAVFTMLRYFVSAYTVHWSMVMGVIFVLVVLFLRGGIVGFFIHLRKGFSHGGIEG